MRGDDLDDLLVLGEARLQMRRRGEMPGPTLPFRERLVRDVADQVLEEPVLAVLGRPRVGLHAEHLLANERREEGVELHLGQA